MTIFNKISERLFKSEEPIPESLKKSFDEKFLEPLRREKRSEQIGLQLQIPGELARVRTRLDVALCKKNQADAGVLEKEEAVKAAQAELRLAKMAQDKIHWECFELRGEIEILKARQREHGSEVLTQYIWEKTKQLDQVRNEVRTEERATRRNIVGRSKVVFHTNSPSIEKTLAAIRAAIDQAEAMKASPLTDEKIKARLEEIDKTIPSNYEWTVVEGVAAVLSEVPPVRYTDAVRRNAYR